MTVTLLVDHLHADSLVGGFPPRSCLEQLNAPEQASLLPSP
jgi:hypothetical protein